MPRCFLELCHDLNHDPDWLYAELAPAELIKLDKYVVNCDELARAEWIWKRRSASLLSGLSFLFWLILITALPLWVYVPELGVPLLTIWAVMAGLDTVQYVRWRRDYERSVARLIRFSRARAP